MKRVFCLILALCVLCAPCVAFADELPPDEGTTSIEDENPLGPLPGVADDKGETEPPVLDSGGTDYELTLPLPVYLVDPPAEAEGDIKVYSDHGTAYPGTISTSIYQYFSDLAASLPLGSHYVMYRADRYRYILAYSRDLTLSGTRFFAPSVQYIEYDTTNSNNYLTRGTESSFSVSAGYAFIYSDLGEYPRIFEGVSHREFEALLLLVAGGFIGAYVLRLFSY